ncbi:MAG TPA: monovalent cation/H(+) antiporter subunit G [Acidimicrobiia bacterium]|jgi:multicomponent Na+:H+ antiporter subunit G|nr:monovalent cation/H(+) antiporter subunit G [Acidimicrobiia bacterium]
MEALASISIVVGAMLAAIAALGINRFGDVLSRMHAATKATTLGLALTLIGAAIAIPATGAVVKLLLVIVFQFMTAPVGAHLIGRASFRAGLEFHPSTNYDELSSRIRPGGRGSGDDESGR